MLKVSVITISFNQSNFIKETIESVLNQSYNNIEYIIVDAGSTDGSRDIISKYSGKLKKVIFEDDKGPPDGLNKGFAYATGDILFYLNSDDLLLPNTISKVVSIFNEENDLDVIYGNSIVINELGQVKRKFYSDKFYFKRALYGECYIAQQSFFFKQSLFNKTKGFNISNKSCWDYELMIDLFNQNPKSKKIEEFLSFYRIHKNSITSSKNVKDKNNIEMHKIYVRLVNKNINFTYKVTKIYYRLIRKLLNPRDTIDRIINGPIA